MPECQPARYLSREPRRCETCPAGTGTSFAPQHPHAKPQNPHASRANAYRTHPEPRQSVPEGKQSQLSSTSHEVLGIYSY